MRKMRKYSCFTWLFFSLGLIGPWALSAQSNPDNKPKKSAAVTKKEMPVRTVGPAITGPDGEFISRHDPVGAGGRIEGEELVSYPDLLLGNALQGKAAGLVVMPTLSGLGNGSSDFFLRGNHGMENNQAIVMVDGIERNFDELIAEEIESVELLKDPVTKIQYGPRAANGVLWVTTKRGMKNRRIIRASAEAGITRVTRLPEYIQAYQYATLYNEARRNDGLPEFYTPQQLEGYGNSSGANDFLYPDADYYDAFLKKQSLYRKVSVEVNGGSDQVQYALILGYTGNGGYEKVGDTPGFNRLNMRGNLDVKVTDYLSVAGGIAVQLGIRNWGSQSAENVFAALSTHRPNEYPFLIDPVKIGMPADSTGVPSFGGSMQKPDNLYADMMYGGFSSERNLNSQANLGLNFTLDRIVKGLKASAYVMFDNYNYFMNGQRNTYPTYAVNRYTGENGEPAFLASQMRKRTLQSDQSRLGESTLRKNSWRLDVGYANRFGAHDLSAMLGYTFYKGEVKGTEQDRVNATYTVRFNYLYDRKYSAELDLAYMGSNRFGDGNKFFLSPALGVAWILSNEKFLQHSPQLDLLKLKASYGVLGYDGVAPALTYNTAWSDGGTAQLGEQNKTTSSHITEFIRFGNPDLKWERSSEFTVGAEGVFMQKRLFSEINYFHEIRSDIIGLNTSRQSAVGGGFMRYSNMGKVGNGGIEGSVSWKDNAGDLIYSVGLNVTWSKNELKEWDEVHYPDGYRSLVGKPTDAMMGHQALGLFGKDVSLAGHPSQFLGTYQEGDIAYADLNKDNRIDDRDTEMLGNSFPRTAIGMEIDLRYKQWGLYVLGVAETGVSKWLTNHYYWNKGEDKYSAVTLNRYHPTANPRGTYPRLTSTAGENNFRNSSFWIKNAAFFRMKNVEVSYTLPALSELSAFRDIKFFVRGTNLFVLSGIKELDPELIDAGVDTYPVSMTLTGGVSVRF